METFLTYSARVIFPCLNKSIHFSIELQIFRWFFVIFLIFLLRNFIYVSVCICFKIFMQLKMIRQSAVNSASTLRKLRFLPPSLPPRVLRKRYTHVSYTSTCLLINCCGTRICIVFCIYFLYLFIVLFFFVLLFVHQTSITNNGLPTLLFMNSVSIKNKIKEIETEKRLEKQKQRNIKINTTHFTWQSNKN